MYVCVCYECLHLHSITNNLYVCVCYISFLLCSRNDSVVYTQKLFRIKCMCLSVHIVVCGMCVCTCTMCVCVCVSETHEGRCPSITNRPVPQELASTCPSSSPYAR